MPPQNQPLNQPAPVITETSHQRLPIWVAGVILVVIACGLGYLAFQYLTAGVGLADYEKKIQNAALFLTGGDYNEAISAAEALLPSLQDGSNEYFVARSVRDTAQFATGEKDKRLEAVRNTKEEYILSANIPFEQARAVNVLLGYLNAGFEQYIFDEVFSGEPFQRFLVKGDRGTSIRQLAEHSFELAPSTESLFRVGQWYSDRMRNLYGDWEATEAEKDQYAAEILKILTQSNTLLLTELAETEGRIFQFTIEPRFHFWQSYLYGVVARRQADYLDDSKASLDKLENTYNTVLDGNGEKISLLATRLPYGYANYAWSLYEVKSEAGYAEARQNLDKLIALVDADPQAHAGYYLSLVRKNMKLSAEKQESTYSARMMLRLAEMHPPFGDFLEKYKTQ